MKSLYLLLPFVWVHEVSFVLFNNTVKDRNFHLYFLSVYTKAENIQPSHFASPYWMAVEGSYIKTQAVLIAQPLGDLRILLNKLFILE